MRCPWGSLSDIFRLFVGDADFAILGCLSAEERCCAVPEICFSDNCRAVELLEIRDPADAFPDYSAETKRKIEQNRSQLVQAGIHLQAPVTDLLATEDQLLDMLDNFREVQHSQTTIVDITSLPKRYFCFFIKRMLGSDSFPNVVVTYTQAGSNGYTVEHLAEDPMTCESLPGYAAPLSPRGNTLVISVGFESLSIRPLLKVYREKKKET